MSGDEKGDGLVPSGGGGSGGDGGDWLVELDLANKVIERVVNAAITATHSGQWCDMQGKPYLTASGAEAVALRCAVSWRNVTNRKEPRRDEYGDFYIYVYEADFTMGRGQRAHTIESIPGTCSSRDQFIGTNFKNGKEARHISEIDEGNIMKAAMSNMIVNGVCRVTGIRNMTWEQLKPLGILLDGAPRITFADGAKGGGQSSGGSAADNLKIKWGNGTGKTVAELDDKDLGWYLGRWEEEIAKADPSKAKYRATTEKMIAAGKEEQARRANQKAGLGAKPTEASFWERLKLLATQQNVPVEKLQTLTRQVLKTPEKDSVNPGALTEQNFKDIADALEVVAKEMEQAKANGGKGKAEF